MNHIAIYRIARNYRKKPAEMVRQVYKLIFSTEELSQMSATGKGRPPPPQHIYDAVLSNLE